MFHGEASFESPHKLRVGDDVLEGNAFVIATGSEIVAHYLAETSKDA